MSATERVRELLDERRVEYRFNEITKVFEWHFEGTDGDGSAHATEVQGGINIIACSLTPEQAIAATLGAGTCHEIEDEDTGFIVCSECGAAHDESYTAYYCWCCGRRIEQ